MRLIAFDTSSFSIYLAASQGGRLVLEEEIAPPEANRQEAVSQLLPSIDRALKKLGWSKSDLDCIVVVNGPGSFTGIRTAVVTARTIAQALEIPVIGISSLECLAKAIGEQSKDAAILITAGRGYFFAAAYGQTDADIAPICVTKQDLQSVLPKQRSWYTDATSRAELESLGNRNFDILDLPTIKNPASIAAEIAWDRLSFFVAQVPSKSDSQTDTCAGDRVGGDVRAACLEEFAFEKILPMYLRGASVTIPKK